MRVVFLRVVGAAEKTLTGPDLQIRGGPGHPYLKMGGRGGRSPKIFFRPLGPQFGLKMKGKPGHSRAPSLDPPLKKQTNKQIGEVFLSISLERLNNALFGKEITVGLLLGLLRNAISLVSNLYLLVDKNLVTAAYANRAHGFISYWSSVFSSVV